MEAETAIAKRMPRTSTSLRAKKLCAWCSGSSCCKRKNRRTWWRSPALTTVTAVSRICVRVAETLAKNIRGSVCLVEANLRSPALPAMFGTTNHHGLTDALLQDGPIRSFTKPVRGENLWLLSSGALASDSAKLLNSERLKTRLAELRKEFDFVLIDAPPLTRYSDAIGLGQMTDGFILVLEANSTRREAALQVAEGLRAANIRILGAVLNKRTFPIPETLYNRL